MTTTNEMILRTLKTKGSKPAKYAEKLREMGYEVSNEGKTVSGAKFQTEYWNVNGLELEKPDRGAIYLCIRGTFVDGLDHIKRIDFENYFATLDARREKAEAMRSHDAIEQRHHYTARVQKYYVDRDGNEWSWCRRGCQVKTRRVRKHSIEDINHTVEEYIKLKRKSEARYAWRDSDADAEIRFAENMLAGAENRVEKLRKQLEAAEREVEERKRAVQREIERKAEGRAELDAWLVAKGIRKSVA